jgi:hypothetical protein
MIKKNLGNAERVARLIVGLGLGYWTITHPNLTVFEWLLLLASFFLVLNSIFSRCYLWYILEIDTCKDLYKDCPDGKPC